MNDYTPEMHRLRDAIANSDWMDVNRVDPSTIEAGYRYFDRVMAEHDAEVRSAALAEALSTEAHPWELLEFRHAWEAADARGEAGTRVRQGLAAMLTRRAALLAEGATP